MNRICKQCGEDLPIESYRKYAARGKGIHNTKQGNHTVCRECENINNRALQIEKNPDKDPELYQQLVSYYKALYDAGLGIASAVAGRYLGQDKPVDNTSGPASLRDKLAERTKQLTENRVDPAIAKLINALRSRAFVTIGAAWAEYDRLKNAGILTGDMREEAARLLDIWEGEEND